jgi:hypothetical protein
MKNIVLIIVFLVSIIPSLFAQKPVSDYLSVDKVVLQIPDSLAKTTTSIASYISANFTSDEDKVRAVFIWLATNIHYDIDNMFAINFYEKKEEKIAKLLNTRKGICENFAAVFTDVCINLGIQAYTVEGYTKQDGFTSFIPHAWNAARIDTTWYLFDATWASGYSMNGKFIKKVDNSYYKVNPSSLIKSHMPFDFLWQFLNYPVTSGEFYENKVQQNTSKPFYSYVDSIKAHESLSHLEQLSASAERIQRNGVKNSMIFDRLQHIKLELENEKQSKMVNLYNAAVADYNGGINTFNEFIQYRNKQFKPKKTDTEIQEMIDVAANHLKDARLKLSKIEQPDVNVTTLVAQLDKGLSDVEKQVLEQQNWLTVYFSKGKVGRNSMFYETKTWWD